MYKQKGEEEWRGRGGESRIKYTFHPRPVFSIAATTSVINGGSDPSASNSPEVWTSQIISPFLLYTLIFNPLFVPAVLSISDFFLCISDSRFHDCSIQTPFNARVPPLHETPPAVDQVRGSRTRMRDSSLSRGSWRRCFTSTRGQ